jgi:hypothetical protein
MLRENEISGGYFSGGSERNIALITSRTDWLELAEGTRNKAK